MPTAPYQDEALVGLLPLTVRHRPHERAGALLCRLAVRRGSGDLREFARGILHFPWLPLGSIGAGRKLDLVSRMSGFSEEVLRRSTPVRTAAGFALGDVLIERAGRLMPGHSNGRVCPACLAGDLEDGDGPADCRPHRRFWWDLEEINGCPRHGTPLLAACPSCGVASHLVNLRPDRCVCGFDLSTAATGPTCAGFDGVLRDVMLGLPRPAWSEGMPVRIMSGLALRLGMLAELGPRHIVPGHLEPALRMQLSAQGAEVLDSGGGILSAALDRAVARGMATTPGEAYGSLWSWLNFTDDAALLPFKDGLIDHARSSLRSRTPIVMFGTPIEPRGACPSPATIFDAPDFATWLRRMKASRPADRIGDVALAMGVTVGKLNSTGRGGAGERLPGAVRGSASTYRYDVPGVVAMLERAALAPVFESVPETMVELLGVRRLKLRWADAHRAVREGRLGVSGLLAGRVGVQALLVLRLEVQRVCRPDREVWPDPVLSHGETMRRLRVSRKTLTALLQVGLIDIGRRLSADNRTVPAPTLSSVERFGREWVTAAELHHLSGLSFQRVAQRLAAAGLESALPRRPAVIPVFVREPAIRCLGLVANDEKVQSRPNGSMQ